MTVMKIIFSLVDDIEIETTVAVQVFIQTRTSIAAGKLVYLMY